MKIDDNPFERWDLDPRDDHRRLTRSMRETARNLSSEDKEQLQEDWRRLMANPVASAEAIALTPAPIARHKDPWTLARELIVDKEPPVLEPLQSTLEDVLVLPLLQDHQLYADPPFLPALMRASRRRQRSSKEQG